MLRKTILTTVLLMMVMLFAAPADAVTKYNSPEQMGREIQKGLDKHKSVISVYSNNRVRLLEEVISPYIYGRTSEGHIQRERKSWQGGDYNYYCYVMVSRWKTEEKRETNGSSYYKYTLYPTYHINKKKSDYINRKTKKAARYVKKYRSDRAKVKAVCRWLAKNMSYKITGDSDLYRAFRGKGQCYHYSLMFYKIAREAGLETRYISGYSGRNQGSHAWCLVKVGNRWYYSDPTYSDAGKEIDPKFTLMKVKGKVAKRGKYRLGMTYDLPAYRDLFTKIFPIAR